MTSTPPPQSKERPHRVQLSRKKGWRLPENTVTSSDWCGEYQEQPHD
jgi:hypothetical protein